MKLDIDEIKRKAELIKQMFEIEQKYEGFSNIPIGPHEYWGLRKEFQIIQAKENS